MSKPALPNQIQVDLGAIRRNLGIFRAHCKPSTTLMAVVKANAYGHGAAQVAQAALQAGATWLGVAQLHEALELRRAAIHAPILVMGYVRADAVESAIANHVHFALFDESVARAANDAALRLGLTAHAHLKIDTGMGRLGLLPPDAPGFMRMAKTLQRLSIDGLYTHFSCADCDAHYTLRQIETFENAIAPWRTGRLIHACNSAGAMAFAQAHYGMVRVGVAQYGLNPFAPGPLPAAFAGLEPALRWTTRIAQIKTMPAGSAISYGATYRTTAGQRIAVIPVGYGDGFRRSPNFGQVLVGGQRCPIVGRVCMDNTMIDISVVPGAKVDDEVVILGSQAGQTIAAEDIATRVGTINYDITTSLLARVPRSYV